MNVEMKMTVRGREADRVYDMLELGQELDLWVCEIDVTYGERTAIFTVFPTGAGGDLGFGENRSIEDILRNHPKVQELREENDKVRTLVNKIDW